MTRVKPTTEKVNRFREVPAGSYSGGIDDLISSEQVPHRSGMATIANRVSVCAPSHGQLNELRWSGIEHRDEYGSTVCCYFAAAPQLIGSDAIHFPSGTWVTWDMLNRRPVCRPGFSFGRLLPVSTSNTVIICVEFVVIGDIL